MLHFLSPLRLAGLHARGPPGRWRVKAFDLFCKRFFSGALGGTEGYPRASNIRKMKNLWSVYEVMLSEIARDQFRGRPVSTRAGAQALESLLEEGPESFGQLQEALWRFQ